MPTLRVNTESVNNLYGKMTHLAKPNPAGDALGWCAVGLEKVAQRQAGQPVEARRLGRLKQPGERQLQPTVHTTNVAALANSQVSF
jgi:hypothetical protein